MGQVFCNSYKKAEIEQIASLEKHVKMVLGDVLIFFIKFYIKGISERFPNNFHQNDNDVICHIFSVLGEHRRTHTDEKWKKNLLELSKGTMSLRQQLHVCTRFGSPH